MTTFSVIIPTYNRKDFLGTAIDSVLNQTYSDFEIIVVDDASTDGTADWLRSAYPSVRLLELSQNSGCAKARNEAVKVAKGEYLAFLDSDDTWLPTFLEMQVKAFQDPQTILGYSDYVEVRPNGKRVERPSKRNPLYPDLTEHLLMENFIRTMSIVAIRRTALIEVGYFNETLPNCSDRDIYLRLSHLGNFVHTPQSLVNRVLHTKNLVNNYDQWANSAFRVMNMFFADHRSQPYRHLRGIVKSNIAFTIARNARGAGNRDRKLQARMWVKAFWYSPTYSLRKLLTKFANA
jgi:glycosyltransferase involved in cell wall biosynthesis